MRGTRSKNWVGFDTETCLGTVKLLAASNGQYIEMPSTIQSIDFLYRQLPSIHDAGTFYNLRFDASAILRDAALSDPENVRAGDFEIGTYRVHHVPGKALVIAPKGGNRLSAVHIYDAAQFYPGGLDRAAKAVLGVGKNADELGVDRERIGNEVGYYEANRDRILPYCIQDAKLAGQLMAKFQSAVGESVGVYPASWYSGASVAKSILTELWVNPYYDWPTELIADSVSAFSGGIFDTRILGRVEKACEYDINSAYPYAISGLPSISDPRPVTEQDPANFGFYLVSVPYDGLLPYRMPDRKTIIYPKSEEPLEAWLYSNELADYPDARIIRGWEFDTCWDVRPFRTIVRRLFQMRREYKSAHDPREGAVKVAMNSMFGAFAETKHGWTRFTNLVYAGAITAITRSYIRGMVRMSPVPPVSIATDSVTYAGLVDFPSNDGLGNLKQSFVNVPLVTYANGIRIIDGRLAKVRGLPRKVLRGESREKVDLTADDFLNAVGDSISLTGTGPLPLVSGIVQRRQNEIASWVDIPKKVSLSPNLIRGVPDGPLTFEYLRDHAVTLHRRLVSTDPTFKILTPPQLVALENNQYPGPFRIEDVGEEIEE